MSKIMEAKWREFREGNPLTRKREEEPKPEEKEADEESPEEEEPSRCVLQSFFE